MRSECEWVLQVKDGWYLAEISGVPASVPDIKETIEVSRDEEPLRLRVVDREWTVWDDFYFDMDRSREDCQGVSVKLIVEACDRKTEKRLEEEGRYK